MSTEIAVFPTIFIAGHRRSPKKSTSGAEGGRTLNLRIAKAWLTIVLGSGIGHSMHATRIEAKMAHSIPWEIFSQEMLSLFTPPLRARASRAKMEQCLREYASASHVSTTADLTPASIAEFARSLQERGLQSATIRGLLAYLRSALRYATEAGYCERNPFDARRVWVRLERPQPIHPLDASDIRQLLDFTSRDAAWRSARLHALIATVAYTGLRRSEALHLQVQDVHTSDRILSIVSRGSFRPKTVDSAAPVPIPIALASILDSWIPRVESIWMFPASRDRSKPWTSGGPGRRPLDELGAAGREIGLHVNFLALRHAWASLAESQWGLSELIVQRVLRHTTPLTQRFYRHPIHSSLVHAVERIDF